MLTTEADFCGGREVDDFRPQHQHLGKHAAHGTADEVLAVK
jgi:hypothetical protein